MTAQGVVTFADKAEAARNKFIQDMMATNQQVAAEAQKTTAAIEQGAAVAAEKAYEGGMAANTQFGVGFSDAEEDTLYNMDQNMTMLRDTVGGSLPKRGPLAGSEGQNPAYFGGRSIMEQFAAGITDSATMLADAVEDTLDASVYQTFEAYSVKMEELSKQRNLLGSVAKKIVGQFGGEIKTAEFEGEKINVERRMQAMINIPGMAGVVAAVVSEGAKTQVILKKIREDTAATAENTKGLKGVQAKGTSLQVQVMPG
jgi:hypothetical protein